MEDLILDLSADPHATYGHSLSVEDRQVDAAGIQGAQYKGLGGDLGDLDGRKLRGGAAAQGHDDAATGVAVVAVDQNAQGAGVRTRHARHRNVPSPPSTSYVLGVDSGADPATEPGWIRGWIRGWI